MTIGSYDQYVRALFDHPVAKPAWYWDDDAPLPEVAPRTRCAYLGELFRHSEAALDPYSDDKIAQGLWFVACGATGMAPAYCLRDPSVPGSERATVVRASFDLFASTMTLRAAQNDLLAELCHCWWDVLPLPWGDVGPDDQLVVNACFETISQILELRCERCKRSSLWGLYIWSCGAPEPSHAIAEQYFSTSRPQSLVDYATKLGLLRRP